MKALEMALEALTNPSTIAVQHAIELIRQALAQPEQKLIGWKDGEPQYVAQPEQEFKYTLYGLRSDENGKLSIGEISQREWVGLTSEELATIVVEHAGFPTKQAQAISDKLKEKNT